MQILAIFHNTRDTKIYKAKILKIHLTGKLSLPTGEQKFM